MKRLQIWCVVLAAGIGLVAFGGNNAKALVEEVQLTADGYLQYAQAISGNYVVYVDRRQGFGDLRIQDMRTRLDQWLGPVRSTKYCPAIDGYRVVWVDERDGAGKASIRSLDLRANTEELLVPYNAAKPTTIRTDLFLKGDLLLWSDNRGTSFDIYGKDLASGQDLTICTASDDQFGPVTYGDWIVWSDYRNYVAHNDWGSDIYAQNLGTGQTVAIWTGFGNQYDPTLERNRLIWTDERNNPANAIEPQTDLYLRDLDQGTTVAFRSNVNYNQDQAWLAQGRVTWIDGRRGTVDAPTNDIYMYDFESRVETAIKINDAEKDAPTISDLRIVYTDYRDFTSQGDIYLTQFDPVLSAGWNLMALPRTPVDPSPPAVFGSLPISETLYRYDPASLGYIAYSEFEDPTIFGNMQVGVGYWLCLNTPTAIEYAGTPLNRPCSIQLASNSWHMIGTPYDVSVPLASCWVRDNSTGEEVSMEQASWNGWVNTPLFFYDPSVLSYMDAGLDPWSYSTVLLPWHGYWLHTGVGNFTLIIPVPSVADITPPVVSISLPTPGQRLNGPTITTSYSATDPDLAYYRVRLDNGPWIDRGGVTTAQFNGVGAGSHTIQVEAVDLAYNIGTSSVSFTVNLPPTASFTWSPTSPTDLENVQFTSTSTDPDGTLISFAWTFGDGLGTGIQNPQHRYSGNGQYTVTLTVTDDNYASSSVSHTITVINVPPSITDVSVSPTSPRAGENVYFVPTDGDLDGTIVSRQWNFGDGGSMTTKSANHVYVTAGTYTWIYTVTDDDGATATYSRPITVAPPGNPPTCNITFTPTSPTAGQSVSFNSHATDPDGTVTGVAWTFGDGNSGTGLTTTHVYATSGAKIVTATVTDNSGATGTCTTTVTVTNTPPTCHIDVTPPSPTIGQLVTFNSQATDSDGTVAAVAWTFGDGGTGTGLTTTHQYTLEGDFPVNVTVTDNLGATGTCDGTVTVLP